LQSREDHSPIGVALTAGHDPDRAKTFGVIPSGDHRLRGTA
jgi:hypothetical protein